MKEVRCHLNAAPCHCFQINVDVFQVPKHPLDVVKLLESCPSVLTELLEYVARVGEHTVIVCRHGNEAILDGSDLNGRRLFFSYFKDLVGREVTVELKNDLAIRGTLHSVDQYLNIKLENTRVVDQDKYPHMVRVFLGFDVLVIVVMSFCQECFIRGSVVRYVQLPPEGVDIDCSMMQQEEKLGVAEFHLNCSRICMNI
ncbi:hypothetical protein GH714_037138 [Hevea brasiliensis]|uniref:Sm domain-containing protein n=1 Tax=Hevea brasiliensis TaxID=3981 RepID=A0A6A6MNR2_HEVBR|nr:hypothetical protein GH714_037138 [Hevea brasiliensis]